MLTVLALFAAPPGRATPLEVYGRLPDVEEVALSPDGSRIALIRTIANDRLLTVISLTDRKIALLSPRRRRLERTHCVPDAAPELLCSRITV
ncbi:MAG: hypothetical protein ACREU6_07520, partial [Steroidobacteraceae bacterium]